jgi:hypothetical protein
MGRQTGNQSQLFYLFNLERRIPADHLLRRINPVVTRILVEVREQLAPFYSDIGRPSIDPELMIRMLIVGYCYGIRFERRLCEESNFTLRTAGFAASISTTRCLIIRHSRIHSPRFDCCVFLFYSLSAVTFATQSARNRHCLILCRGWSALKSLPTKRTSPHPFRRSFGCDRRTRRRKSRTAMRLD